MRLFLDFIVSYSIIYIKISINARLIHLTRTYWFNVVYSITNILFLTTHPHFCLLFELLKNIFKDLGLIPFEFLISQVIFSNRLLPEDVFTIFMLITFID